MSEERMRILEMIEAGTITSEQGFQLIQALDGTVDSEEYEPTPEFDEADIELEPPSATPPSADRPPLEVAQEMDTPPDFNKFRGWWIYPFVGTTLITGIMIIWLRAAISAGWAPFWLFWIWVFIIFWGLMIILSLVSRTARWLHVRVHTGQEEWPRRIAISFPLPLRFLGVFTRFLKPMVPGLRDVEMPIENIFSALQDSATPENPLYVAVDEGPDNENVRVYIG